MKIGKRSAKILALSLFIVLVSPVAARAAKVKTPQVQADTRAKFAVVSEEVLKQMGPGGRFEFVTKEEYAKVNDNLNAMSALFDKFATVSAMDRDTRIALFNDQEVVNSILKRRDSERLICRSELPTGSHIPATKCRTYGDLERSNTETKNFLERFQQKGQPNGGSILPGTIGH
jgi:hypothetical protein